MSGTAAQTAVADNYSIVTPYITGSSGVTQYYFGARIRTGTTVQAPTLGCPRSNADLYTTSSASDGNKQLSKPAALITADEAAFAGSGDSSSTTPWQLNSYLRSGSLFWLLSPYHRNSNGGANLFGLGSNGNLNNIAVHNSTYGVRPAISLTSGTTATSGSGTATDPWVVEAPKTMQTSTTCDTTLTDARDGNTYTVATINGACWMTQNLRYLGDTGSAAKTMTIGNDNSNVANKSITLYSLDSSDAGNFNAYSSHCDSTNSYNYACVYDSGSTSTGVWYNYAAATAGTITGSPNDTDATYDICPAGWHLPTHSEFSDITSYSDAFSPVTGGLYRNGSLFSTGGGYWWSVTVYNTTNRYALGWNGSSLDASGNIRYLGGYVRCVSP